MAIEARSFVVQGASDCGSADADCYVVNRRTLQEFNISQAAVTKLMRHAKPGLDTVKPAPKLSKYLYCVKKRGQRFWRSES